MHVRSCVPAFLAGNEGEHFVELTIALETSTRIAARKGVESRARQKYEGYMNYVDERGEGMEHRCELKPTYTCDAGVITDHPGEILPNIAWLIS